MSLQDGIEDFGSGTQELAREGDRWALMVLSILGDKAPALPAIPGRVVIRFERWCDAPDEFAEAWDAQHGAMQPAALLTQQPQEPPRAAPALDPPPSGLEPDRHPFPRKANDDHETATL